METHNDSVLSTFVEMMGAVVLVVVEAGAVEADDEA
jgi:hypothetical protein